MNQTYREVLEADHVGEEPITKRMNDRFTLKVERCYGDIDQWVWTVLCDGGDLCDGYEGSPEEAMAKARQAFEEHMEYLNGAD